MPDQFGGIPVQSGTDEFGGVPVGNTPQVSTKITYPTSDGGFLDEALVNPLRQAGAGVYGAAAGSSHLGANVFDLFDKAADGISQATGIPKGGLFGHVRDWLREQETAATGEKNRLSGGRNDFLSQVYRGGTEGLLSIPQYAVAAHTMGPVAGMAAIGAISEEDKGWREALMAAAQGALTGGALSVMGPASRPIRLTGAAAMTYAQSRLNGADNATALANAVTMGGMNAMHPGGATAREIGKNAVNQGIDVATDLAGRAIKRSHLNEVEQKAVDFLKEEGVPMRAGVQTGNKYLQAAEGVTAATPLGAPDAAKLRLQTEEGLRGVGDKLMNEVHPEAQTPESAGQSVREDLDTRIGEFADTAEKAYGNAWKGRDNPAFTQEVPLRTDEKGKTVTGPVNMPVDISDLKEQGRPIYDELDTKLSHADKAQSAAFSALEKLLQLPDNIEAWRAEPILSALKSMSRTSNKSGVRDYGQGVAAGLVPKLQERIDAAVAKSGEEAIRGLQEGREAHANKMDVVDVVEKLRAEPVQAFNQATWKHDTGINFLRRLNFDAPGSMPKVGRALVQQLVDLATREGGLQRTKEVLNSWRDLGPQTKELLIPDEKVRGKLDNFFKGMDLVIDRTNPSGTEITRQATSLNPMRWIAGYVGGKALFTERGIDLLTQGLRVPENSARGRMIREELQGMGGGSGSFVNKAKEAFDKAKEVGKKVIEDEEGSITLVPGSDEFRKAEEGRRGKRETAEMARVYAAERKRLDESIRRDLPDLPAKEAGKAVEAALQQVRDRKKDFPQSEEFPFQPLEVKRVKWEMTKPKLDKDGNAKIAPQAKPTIEYAEIPYAFDREYRGQPLWKRDQLTPAGEKVSQRLADEMVGEVKSVLDAAARAEAKNPAERSVDDRTAMKIGAQKDWYNQMRTLLRRIYGSAGDMFGDLLGATSARTPVETNFNQGQEALENFTKGRYDQILEDYRQHREGGGNQKSYTGELALREGGKKYNANTMAVMDALIGMFRGKEGAPKTQNYSGNLVGNTDLATIDVWAARLLQRLRHKAYGDAPPIPQPAEGGVAGEVINDANGMRNTGQFMFGQKVFDKAAEQLGMKPHELQAFVWFLEKDLWTRKGLTSKAGEGGDMAAIAKSTGLGRILAGIEPQESSAPQHAVMMMRDAQRVAREDPNVKSVVNSHALGMWSAPGGDNTGKPVFSSQFEVTLPENNDASINRIAAEIVKAAQRNNQDDAFIARTIPEESTSAVHARPGLSVYFKSPLEAEAAWKVIEQIRTDNIGGFTLFGGPGAKPGQYLGMRFVYMPEYVFEAAEIARMSDAEVEALVQKGKADALLDMDTMRAKLARDERVGHAMVEAYDVLNANKEDYGRLIEQLEQNTAGRKTGVAEGSGEERGGPWRLPIGRSVKERALARSGGAARAAASSEGSGNGGQAQEERVNPRKRAFEERKRKRGQSD